MRAIIAADVMTPTILRVDEATSLTELANFLIDHEITGAVVTNEDGDPVGVVSFTDIAAATALAGEKLDLTRSRMGFYAEGWDDEGWPEDALDESDLETMRVDDRELTAGEIMTPELYSVPVDMPISEVARLMCDSHLHRVLVLAEGDYVGIITTSDLLGLLVDDKT